MKRKLMMGILALGVVGGYGWGFATLGCHRHHAQERRASFERHVAQICVDAALQATGRTPGSQGEQGDLRK